MQETAKKFIFSALRFSRRRGTLNFLTVQNFLLFCAYIYQILADTTDFYLTNFYRKFTIILPKIFQILPKITEILAIFRILIQFFKI